MLTVFAGIIAVAKAVPAIRAMIDSFFSLYVSSQVESADRVHQTKTNQITAQVNAISKAKTNEERKALSITLDGLINS